MSGTRPGIDLETSLGYLLKEAATALRVAMEGVLKPLGMTVTHYSCLELLSQRPGLSNSELARGAFVSRQSMNVLLQSLERDGFVVRPAEAPVGRALPTRLTPLGRRELATATMAVKSVEERMLNGLSDEERTAARRLLRTLISSLQSTGASAATDEASATAGTDRGVEERTHANPAG
jgi:DNA-binding MarR family transcriptional regulator